MLFKPEIHHRMSVNHLMSHKEAALFAGMGLGKTASTLTAFNGLKMMGLANSMLVVAPLRVATLTWPNEIEKWDHLKHLTFADLRKKEGYRTLERSGADIYIINYEQLQKFRRKYLEEHDSYHFDTVCFDELTAAKNHGSKRINCVRQRLVNKRGVTRRWGLTGTPTPNGLMELFGQIRLLDGGKRLGPAFSAFRSAYFEAQDYMEYHWEPKAGAKAKIYGRINDIVLSLPQETYSKIPLPVTEDLEVGLPEVAKDQYHELERQLLLLLEDETEVVAVNAAALMNKLLQITGGAVYREDKTVANIHNAKIEAVKKFAAPIKSPVIVACMFRHEKARLLKALAPAVLFENSKQFLKDWNADKYGTLIVDPRELSHGLNMQEGSCRNIVWFTCPWSREQYDQLNGRLIRSGQKQQVRVTRVICPGTVDDAVVESLRQRGEGQRALMSALNNFKRLAS